MIWHERSLDPCFTLESGSARTFENDGYRRYDVILPVVSGKEGAFRRVHIPTGHLYILFCSTLLSGGNEFGLIP
jgi:hypothetical protein